MDSKQRSNFLGTVRAGKSSTQIEIESTDEAAATRLLELLYGSENVIDVRAVGEDASSDQVSQAEIDVSNAVSRDLRSAFVSVAKWIIRGAIKR
jgi:hypothetical protein